MYFIIDENFPSVIFENRQSTLKI